MSHTTLIVDGHNLAFRVLYALPDLSSNGQSTRVLFGFLQSLNSYLTLVPRGSKIVVVWDSGSTRRKGLDPTYKANRKPHDPSAMGWLESLQEFLPKIGVSQASCPGEEADDVIYSICKNYEGSKVVVTQDTDLLTVVDHQTVVAIPGKKGVFKLYDTDRVQMEYGFEPKGFPLWLAIVGDASDNIKGVPRFPSKTAASMVKNYGDVDTLFSSGFPGLTRKQYESMKTCENSVRSNLLLTSLFSVEPVMTPGATDFGGAEEMLKSLEIDPKVIVGFKSSRQGFLKFS